MLYRFTGVILLQSLLLSVCTAQNGCEDPTKCKMLEIENNLNQIKAAQITEQERQRTMAQVFSSQFTKLNRDVTATKTVLNRIVEDAVNMQGKLRVLQGVGTDISRLRGQVQSHSNKIDALIDKTTGLDGRTAQMNTEMERLKQTGMPQTSGSGETATGLVRELRETIQGLTSQLQGLNDKFTSQLVAVRNEIEEIKKETRRSSLYPWQ